MSDPPSASDYGGQPARLEYVAGPDEAGDAACWAQLVCPECGAVRSEGTCRCDEGRDTSETGDAVARSV